MVPELRSEFNRSFTPEKYRRLLDELHRRCNSEIPFRVSETPCFFPQSLLDKMSDYGHELVLQLLDDSEYRRVSQAIIPAEYNVPGETPNPMFVQVDFGLVRDDAGNVEPKLVELQAFPSLYGYQAELAEAYLDAYSLRQDLVVFLGGSDRHEYERLFCRAILGDCRSENVVLLEIDPAQQKTRPDFNVTERICGITTVNIREVVKHGRKLFYRASGWLVPIQRIYNRTIVDELVRKGISLPFDMRDEMDVQWAGHPNWYFRISKFSIPFLKHACVPRTWFLDRVDDLPLDRENLILKPLFSFAGTGITFAPTDEQLAAIPSARRSEYILQERMKFAPVIDTPHGPTQAEVRIMYIWVDKLRPVLALVRMGRGKMMGVDHNKDMEWVGSSAALAVPG
jgi:hypothetical protein